MFRHLWARKEGLPEWLPVAVDRLVKAIQASASDIVEALDRQTEAFQQAQEESLAMERLKAEAWMEVKAQKDKEQADG